MTKDGFGLSDFDIKMSLQLMSKFMKISVFKSFLFCFEIEGISYYSLELSETRPNAVTGNRYYEVSIETNSY
jgi:hypothetical protein